ncbi:hypothetical protein [Streptomyces sp. ME19-01-6]|uniref:hypothetical protein n=1 Tax=Streptomyces sp. ME19-01-6 TaxID=3028686 RepID=UPI0029B1E365|nr:hypothetical protein [Streptomyces sp. ME19-01-6]MDX3227623.1 hypothetical protein [Streptomyces sp. ME19-01-6]
MSWAGQLGQGVVLWNVDGTVTPVGLPPGETLAGMTRLGEHGPLLVTASHQFINWPGGHPRVTARIARAGNPRGTEPPTMITHLSAPPSIQ